MSLRVRVAVIAAAALLGGSITALLINQSSGSTETARGASEVFPSGEESSARSGDVARTNKTRDPRLPSEPLSTFSADLEDNLPKQTAAPTRLTIKALALDFAIRPLGVDKAGAMALPATVQELSWYKFGSGPNEPGATVLAGHVDTKTEGIGPLARLEGLNKGDRITVRVGQKSLDYRVDEVRQVSKSLLDLEALFARSGPQRLHLVTCAGAYDPARGGYQANLVVVARPVN